jgi:hypothetical protein
MRHEIPNINSFDNFRQRMISVRTQETPVPTCACLDLIAGLGEPDVLFPCFSLWSV